MKRPFACYDKERLADIRERVSKHTVMREEYERQLKLSDQYVQKEAAVPVHLIGAYRTSPFVFRTPANAAYMKMAVHFRGMGEVRIGRLQLTHSERGLPMRLQYGAFEEGLAGWKVTPSMSGTIIVRPAAPFSPSCVYMKNPQQEDWTVLVYEESIPVRALEHYSMQTTLRLDELLTDGVYAEVRFLDAAGKQIGESFTSPAFNRRTPTMWSDLLEIAGADADVYMVTGEPKYAERVKRKFLYMLPDMCQGMDIFKATGWHVDDVYGAVHIGRGMAVMSVIYDQISGSGVIAPEEDEEIKGRFRYIARLMMDTGYYKFHLEEFPDEKGGKRSNWNADRATGLGVYALIFPEEELAEEYLEHACAVVDWQLEHVVDQDGAWPENIRYHGAVLHRYFLFFALLQRHKGIDYWSHDKVKGMYRFLIGTVLPKDSVQGGPDSTPKLLSPAVGDNNVNDQWFRLFAYAAPFYAESEPELSRHMMWAWYHGGHVVRDTGAFPCTLLSLLYPEPELPQEEPSLSSVYYPGIGYILFRQHFGVWGQENFAIYEASPLTYHAHHDEGHFSIWSDSTPLTLDPGTGGYYNGDRHWYVYGHAHNVVQFIDESGAPQDGPLKSVCEEVHFSPQLDYVRSSIPDHHADSYRRHFAYVKAGVDAYVVWDHICSEKASVWNLNTLSTSSDIGVNRITSHCLNGKKLETTFLEPAQISVTADRGAVGGAYPLAVQEQFRIGGEPGSDYLAVLYPKSGDSQGLTVQALPLQSASTELRMYKVARALDEGEAAWFLLLVNGSDQEITFSFQADAPLQELQAEASHQPDDQNGLCHVKVGGGRLTILVGA